MSPPEPHDEAAPLALGPDCTIRAIAASHAAIRRAASPLRLDCSGIEQADLSFVQLIASAQATHPGRLTLEAPPDCVQAAFARAGVPLPHPAP